jgi:hypothetical protein
MSVPRTFHPVLLLLFSQASRCAFSFSKRERERERVLVLVSRAFEKVVPKISKELSMRKKKRTTTNERKHKPSVLTRIPVTKNATAVHARHNTNVAPAIDLGCVAIVSSNADRKARQEEGFLIFVSLTVKEENNNSRLSE